ncbi:GTP-binding protein obg [Streptomyces laurentii]|uniref:GTP-binding protein obg n=1 Tax=Streptomyces laurentii TaxID=39478 RepID=A0A160NUD5_STRLU|nr:GTP-binding protein obg [Streptomyces laurentii]
MPPRAPDHAAPARPAGPIPVPAKKHAPTSCQTPGAGGFTDPEKIYRMIGRPFYDGCDRGGTDVRRGSGA